VAWLDQEAPPDVDEHLVDQLDIALVGRALDGRIVSWNDAATRLFGWTESDAVGQPYGMLLVGERDLDAEATAASEGAWSGHVAFRTDDGPALDARVQLVAWRVDGVLRGFVTAVFPELDGTGRRGRRSADRTVERQLRLAIEHRTLPLYAQPIVDAATGRTVQREVLVRLPGPTGIVLPDVFLPVAERTGLVVDLDRYVVVEALRHSRYGVSVELNLSPVSLRTDGFAEEIGRLISTSDVDPAQIVFEITESAIIADADAALYFAEHLAAVGCRFALDDFGTGFNGLLQLRRFPVDFLKIDREFVRNMLSDDRNRPIVRAVIALASHLGVRTVAEGVEDEATLELLRADGVDLVQGYFLGRPEPLPA
jgi:PAS domain S-box-containing protein